MALAVGIGQVADSMVIKPPKLIYGPVSCDDAKDLIGPRNFIGIEATECLGVTTSQYEAEKLSMVRFDPRTLERSGKSEDQSWFLVALPPLSILEFRDRVNNSDAITKMLSAKEDFADMTSLFALQGASQLDVCPFAMESGEFEWHLISRKPARGSKNKEWSDQKACIRRYEYVPTAREMFCAIILLYLHTDERVFRDVSVRCSDVPSMGGRSHTGRFDSTGLGVGDHYEQQKIHDMGLAVATQRI